MIQYIRDLFKILENKDQSEHRQSTTKYEDLCQ